MCSIQQVGFLIHTLFLFKEGKSGPYDIFRRFSELCALHGLHGTCSTWHNKLLAGFIHWYFLMLHRNNYFSWPKGLSCKFVQQKKLPLSQNHYKKKEAPCQVVFHLHACLSAERKQMPPHPRVASTAENCPGVTSQPVTAQIRKIPTPRSTSHILQAALLPCTRGDEKLPEQRCGCCRTKL